jgi:hypothetical protein
MVVYALETASLAAHISEGWGMKDRKEHHKSFIEIHNHAISQLPPTWSSSQGRLATSTGSSRPSKHENGTTDGIDINHSF